MANVYRANFDIVGPGSSGMELFGEVETFARDWAANAYDLPGDYVEGSEWVSERDGDSVLVESGKGEGEGHFHLKAERDGCHLGFWLASQNSELQATVELRLSEEDERTASAPLFLSGLISRFHAQFEGEELSTDPLILTLDSAATFGEDLAFNPDRKLPLVVISGENSYAHSLLKPQRLAGIATLVLCPDIAVDAMNERLGSLRCYGGTVRVYFPQCSPTDHNWTHPFWPNSRLRQLGKGFYPELRDNLMAYLAMRPRTDFYGEVAAHIRASQHQHDLALSHEAAEQATLEILSDTERELRSEIDQYKSENAELKQTVFRLRQRINALEGRDDTDEDITVDMPESLQEFRSVTDVLEQATRELTGIRILESAFKSARNVNFPGRDRIWEVFEKMDKCSEVLKARGGSLGKSHEQWFQEVGLEFASSESDTTMSKYPGSRTFMDSTTGTQWEMPAHFKLGGNQLRIHVLWMQDEGCWLVGHVGGHLPTGGR